MKKKPDNNYLCFIINETKTGVKVTPGKPAIIYSYETSFDVGRSVFDVRRSSFFDAKYETLQ